MEIKLELSAEQLNALHSEIQKEDNRYFEASDGKQGQHKYFVWIVSAEGTGKELYPIPKYKVTLSVREKYQEKPVGDPFKTPLNRLQSVLQAIGLFPSQDGVKAE